MTTTRQQPVTWNELVALEPRLAELRHEAASMNPSFKAGYCEQLCYYRGTQGRPSLKRRINELVGWYRPEFHPRLSTEEAWRVVVREIVSTLPPCECCHQDDSW